MDEGLGNVTQLDRPMKVSSVMGDPQSSPWISIPKLSKDWMMTGGATHFRKRPYSQEA